MKIRLPSSLMNGGNQGGIETANSSDDISCSSENSSGNRSARSFLSRSRSRSRSRSISRLRPRSRSLRGDKAANAANANTNTNTNANTNANSKSNVNTSTVKRPKSPTKRIMKRLQKSFASSSSPKKKIGNLDDEKENTIPSSSSSSSDTNNGNETNDHSNYSASYGSEIQNVDSTIVSIADRAVARNFPSSCIRPVPIEREELHVSLAQYEESGIEEQTTKISAAGANGISNIEAVVQELFKEHSNKSTTKKGKILANGVLSNEAKDNDGIEGFDGEENTGGNMENSPYSIGPSNSLLPPLDDDGDDGGDEDSDDNGHPKMVLPETHTDGAIQSPKMSKGRDVRTKAYLPPPTPPPPITNPCVTSPLSDGSALFSDDAASSSCNSSISMVRGSLALDSDDGSNDHIACLTKSTFKPPREVVTITSSPIVAGNSNVHYTTPGRRRKQKQELLPNPSKNTSKSQKEKETRGERNKESSGCSCSSAADRIDDDETKTAKELAAKLVVDLEELREENEKHVLKNRRLEVKLQILKAQQDEHMVHRGRLIKACLYTAPVFVLCGGLDAFLATILLVWVLIEVESYLDGNEGHDEEDGDGEDDDSQNVGDEGSGVESFGDDESSMAL